MDQLSDMTRYVDEYLRTGEISDYANALNGLQLQNAGHVARIVAAVDAVEPVIDRAARVPSSLLIVHHGLFWPGLKAFTGALYRKTRRAIEGDLAIYSSHLPLDLHPEVGNSIGLFRALGLEAPEPFFLDRGHHLGLRARCSIAREELIQRVRQAVDGPVQIRLAGPETVTAIGVVTGGAGADIYKAASEGIDTFITGEGPHWSFTAADELCLNAIYGGHYATETFGVKALAAHLSAKFSLPWEWIDHPTGL